MRCRVAHYSLFLVLQGVMQVLQLICQRALLRKQPLGQDDQTPQCLEEIANRSGQ
jgi:hypothetical protein